MFVFSVRSSTIKFFLLILVTLTILITLVNIGDIDTVYASVGDIKVNLGGMRTNEDRVAFIEGLGVEVEDEPTTEESFTSPDSFDRIISDYNELQKSQGLDLTKYKGKRITHYAYRVTNYDYDGIVYVNLLVYKNRIVGCDISSGDGEGFVSALIGLDTSRLKK